MPAGLRSTEPLWEHLPEIASALRAAPEILLFLDFDGTLAPIVEDPSLASMPAATHQALARLASDPRFSLAIISGRALSDLRLRVDLENLIYAGNHGLEISGNGVEFIEPTAAQHLKALGELSRHLRARLHDIPGVEVENKILSASVHFRRAPAGSLPEIRQIVKLLRRLGQESKLGPTAVLVSTDVAFGIIRTLEALVEDVCEVKPFREEQEARAWLAMK